MKRWWLLFIILLFNVSLVSAIGLSPVRFDIDFQPFLEETFEVSILNSGDYPINASLSFGGDLAEYVNYTAQQYYLDSRASQKVFFTLQLPGNIETPGRNTIDIIAKEIVNPNQQIVVGTVAVIKLSIFVPYPGRYLELSTTPYHTNEGEPLQFELKFLNKGRDNLSAVQGLVELNTLKNVTLTTARTNIFSLNNNEQLTKNLVLDDGRLKPGDYYFISLATYDTKVTSGQQGIVRVGSRFINVTNYTRTFTTGSINRLEIMIQSRWNNDIKDVYGNVIIIKDGTTIAGPFKTLNTFLDKWDEKKLTAFFDTTTIQPGSYDANITLHYEGITSTVTVPIDVQDPPTASFNTIIMIGILAVILINILFFWFRRRKEKKNIFTWKKHLDTQMSGKDLFGEDSSWKQKKDDKYDL